MDAAIEHGAHALVVEGLAALVEAAGALKAPHRSPGGLCCAGHKSRVATLAPSGKENRTRIRSAGSRARSTVIDPLQSAPSKVARGWELKVLHSVRPSQPRRLTPFCWPESNILPAQRACGRGLAQSETPCTWRCPFVGTREISSVSGQHSGPAHEGKSRTMGMHADEKSDGRMVPVKPRTKPSDSGGGDGGGMAAGQGKSELQRMLRTQRRNRHVTEAASPRIGAVWVPVTPKADHVRPETRARCGKAARRDLRGG